VCQQRVVASPQLFGAQHGQPSASSVRFLGGECQPAEMAAFTNEPPPEEMGLQLLAAVSSLNLALRCMSAAGAKVGTPSASTAPPPPPLPPSGRKGGRRGRPAAAAAAAAARASSPSAATTDTPGDKAGQAGADSAAAPGPDGAQAGPEPGPGGGEGGEGETAEAQARSMVMKDLAEGQSGQVCVRVTLECVGSKALFTMCHTPQAPLGSVQGVHGSVPDHVNQSQCLCACQVWVASACARLAWKWLQLNHDWSLL
jgi:hypothetical protein